MMKKTLCLILVLVFLFLVGCKDNSLPVDEVIAETDSHIVFRSGKDCFLRFYDEYSKSYPEYGSGRMCCPGCRSPS